MSGSSSLSVRRAIHTDPLERFDSFEIALYCGDGHEAFHTSGSSSPLVSASA